MSKSKSKKGAESGAVFSGNGAVSGENGAGFCKRKAASVNAALSLLNKRRFI
jgi:hypothetical protein